MTQDELIKIIEMYRDGEIYMDTVLTAVDAYSSASNNGKPIVMRSFAACPSCGSNKIYFEGHWTCRDCTADWGGK